jgi:RNA polymerase sigma-70 factor (ECF subfamily)
MRKEATISNASAEDSGEALLAEGLRARSPEAWEQLYAEHFRLIYRYVRARVFDEATAEDLTASVFVEAISSIGSYRYQGKPILAWLYRIARNVVGTHQRRSLRRRDPTKKALDLPGRLLGRVKGGPEGDDGEGERALAAADARDDPEQLVERLDLQNALNRIPGPQRDVLILRFWVGLSTQEIADVLGKKPVAVYSLEARALASLRRRLR